MKILSGLFCLDNSFVRKGENLLQMLINEMNRVWNDRFNQEFSGRSIELDIFNRLLQLELSFYFKVIERP